ncbi:hypothetical protein PR202_gb20256 [Eleusine coracana subsp. coracana]|uniref:Retrotransposon gag domain-containing protein n=1 Tax=Eleusine coracana subsp. coracana TaxID=191504 RepID=A0AAV5FA64_ELECO|nr:hypothetical protein PR202_gb20256 [Eleusine coracana subsp. coracana]
MGDHGFEELSHNGWCYTTGLHHRGFPTLLWDLLHLLGYDEPPSYKGREIRCHGVTLAKVHMSVPTHPRNLDMAGMESTATYGSLREGLERVAHRALTHFCGCHTAALSGTPMVRIRNQDDPESSQQGANAEPSLAEVLAAALNWQQNDSEILRRLVDITSHLAGQGGHRNNNNQPRQSTYSDFLGTHPPTFERTRKPLDANHWLRQTELKFGLLECTKHQKVLFAAQQLQGSASAWWANYEALCPLDTVLNEMSSRLHFVLISFQLASCKGNSKNSWV